MTLETRVERLQARLRSFAFGQELDSMAAEMLTALSGYRKRRADVNNRIQLKALALMAEYLDAHGRSQEAAMLLRLTVEELLSGPMDASEDPKLMRQWVWCCLAYALTHLRANRTHEAGRVILRMRTFVAAKLVRPEFPCHGTIALLRYYEGLWRRNIGQLDAAARDFDMALDQMRLRYETKRQKYEAVDPERLRREMVYSRVMMARVLGFGQGGIALARGRYVEARGWMIAASQILSSLGQEHWRKALDVYARSCAVLIAELEPESVDRLRREAEKLRELSDWFASRNRRNGFVAAAFAILAEVRVRQIEGSEVRSVPLDGLLKRLNHCMKYAYSDAGPLSGTAALAMIECLLRGRQFERCSTELERFERAFDGEEEVLLGHRVLQAEFWMETGSLEAARGSLESLAATRVANRGYRARAWALLALCENRGRRPAWADRAIGAAMGAVDSAQDGFARALVREVKAIVETKAEVLLAMPYQKSGDDDRWCDIDHNLEMARLNVVAAVHAQNPSLGVRELAAAMGRRQSWLYELLGRHKHLDWVGVLVRSENLQKDG
jgi:tetratricopeptide (TPR) repeat protein